MCIAILCPKGTEITAQQFRNCWDNNYNGAGFMYNDDQNKLRVVKEMDSFSRIYNKYKALNKKFPNATFVIHFRISTHGVIDKSNCHPFKVSNELGFVHNGVISAMKANKEWSDTNVFNREILKLIPGLSVGLIEETPIKELLGAFIGHSKLIFMDRFGKSTLVNEKKGNWEKDGIWYSNDSHKRVKNTVDFGGQIITREELAKRQGECTAKANNNSWRWNDNEEWSIGDRAIGYGRNLNNARHYDEDSDDYGVLEGDTYGASKSKNARIGKTYGYDGSIYVVSDGSTPCQCCGQHTLVGELLNSKGECFECISVVEANKIMSAAVIDGAVIEDWNGTVITRKTDLFDDKDLEENFEPEVCECDNCTTVVAAKNTLNLPDWDCRLCADCVDDFIDAGALHESTRINKKTKTIASKV